MSLPKNFQYPLQLSFEPGFESEDFFVSHCNQEAVEWLKNWTTWPRNALVITGPQGSGKTHLSHIWQHWSGALRITLPELKGVNLFDVLTGQTGLVLDAPQVDRNEELLLHLINTSLELACPLLLTAELPPAQWQCKLPDLRSRLNALTVVPIRPPDDRLIQLLLIKQLEDQHIEIPEEVLTFLLTRIERSYAGVRDVVKHIAVLSLSTKRPLTIPLARQALTFLDVPTYL